MKTMRSPKFWKSLILADSQQQLSFLQRAKTILSLHTLQAWCNFCSPSRFSTLSFFNLCTMNFNQRTEKLCLFLTENREWWWEKTLWNSTPDVAEIEDTDYSEVTLPADGVSDVIYDIINEGERETTTLVPGVINSSLPLGYIFVHKNKCSQMRADRHLKITVSVYFQASARTRQNCA